MQTYFFFQKCVDNFETEQHANFWLVAQYPLCNNNPHVAFRIKNL